MSEDLELAETFDYYSGIAVANLGTKEYESSATDNKISEWKDGEKCKDHPWIKMTNEAKKKFSCCPEIGRVKFFLSLTRLHKSHTQTEKFSLANLNVRIYVFFISNN